MNIFSKIVLDEAAGRVRLGCPAIDAASRDVRMNAMAQLTGGRGFRTPPQSPAVHPTTGTTRGERKRAAREAANRRVSEVVPNEHVHPRRNRTN